MIRRKLRTTDARCVSSFPLFETFLSLFVLLTSPTPSSSSTSFPLTDNSDGHGGGFAA